MSRLIKFLLLALLLCINIQWIAAQTTDDPDTSVTDSADDTDTDTGDDIDDDSDTSVDSDTSLDDEEDTDTDSDVDGLDVDDTDTSSIEVTEVDDDDDDTDDDTDDTSVDSETEDSETEDSETEDTDGLEVDDDDDSDTSTDDDDSETDTEDEADADTVETDDDDTSDTSTDDDDDDDTSVSDDTSADTSTDDDSETDSLTGVAAPSQAECESMADGDCASRGCEYDERSGACNAGMSGDRFSAGYNSAEAGSVQAATVNGVLATVCVILGVAFMLAVGGFAYYYQKDKARRDQDGLRKEVAMSEIHINDDDAGHTAYRPKIQAVQEEDEDMDFDGTEDEQLRDGPLRTDL